MVPGLFLNPLLSRHLNFSPAQEPLPLHAEVQWDILPAVAGSPGYRSFIPWDHDKS